MAGSNLFEEFEALSHTGAGLVLFFILGSMVGSFLNVVIARLPEGESIVHPRSHCPRCLDQIPWYLNIPILSWFLLRGRCRNCKLPISIRYPVVELLTGLLFVASLRSFDWTLKTLTTCIFSSALLAITFIDIDIWEIPDEISLPGIAVGVLLRPLAFEEAAWWDGPLAATLGAGALYLVRAIHMRIRGIEGMGLGDVKLIAMIGAFIGCKGLIPCVLIASLSGSVVGIAMLGLKALGGQAPSTDAAPDTTAAEQAAADPAPTGPAPSGAPGDVADPPTPPAPQAEAGAGAPERSPEGREDEEEDWVPPPSAVPFGPFLALGGLTYIYLGKALQHWFYEIGR